MAAVVMSEGCGVDDPVSQRVVVLRYGRGAERGENDLGQGVECGVEKVRQWHRPGRGANSDHLSANATAELWLPPGVLRLRFCRGHGKYGLSAQMISRLAPAWPVFRPLNTESNAMLLRGGAPIGCRLLVLPPPGRSGSRGEHDRDCPARRFSCVVGSSHVRKLH